MRDCIIDIEVAKINIKKDTDESDVKLKDGIIDIEVAKINIKEDTDESDVKLKDSIIDTEVEKINIKDVDIVSEEWPKSNGEDESIIDKENVFMCVTNEEAVTEITTVKWKGE